jgi:hypothetical protein
VTLTTLCNTCLQPFELQVSPDETHLMKEFLAEDMTMPCPRLCGGRILFSTTASDLVKRGGPLRDPIRLTGKEYFKAAHGGGMPDEVPASKEAVESLLIANHVLAMETEQVGRDVYIHEIRLSNKTIIHLTGGQRGAVVSKITRF